MSTISFHLDARLEVQYLLRFLLSFGLHPLLKGTL